MPPAPALSGPSRKSIGVKCSTLGIVIIMKCDKMNCWHHLVVGVDVTRVVPRDAGVGGSYVQPRNGHLLLSPREGRRSCHGTKGLAFSVRLMIIFSDLMSPGASTSQCVRPGFSPEPGGITGECSSIPNCTLSTSSEHRGCPSSTEAHEGQEKDAVRGLAPIK